MGSVKRLAEEAQYGLSHALPKRRKTVIRTELTDEQWQAFYGLSFLN